MPINLKEHITKKAHDASIRKLKTKKVPSKIVKSLTTKFLDDIASSLSEVTKSVFNYTGNVDYKDDSVLVKFTSSETSNVITMVISYDKKTLEEDYTFENLNETIEENIEKEEVKEEVVVEDSPVKEKIASPIPNFTAMVDTAIKIGNEEKEKEKRQKIQEMVDESLDSLEKIEKADKINKILDALEEQTTEEKKEDKLLSILKNV
jgi:hypothetical protein